MSGALTALLPAIQRRWHAIAFVILLLLCADTLFLLAHRGLREIDGWLEWGRVASHFYQASVLLHSAFGYLLSAVLAVFVCMHLPNVLRRLRRRWWLALSGFTVVGLYGFLLYSGSYFLVHAKTADRQWLYWGHMGLSALFLGLYAVHRLIAAKRFPRRQLAGLLVPAFAVALVMIIGETAEVAFSDHTKVAVLDPARARGPKGPGFMPASGMDVAAPFFPSPVALASGASTVDTSAIIGPSKPNMAAEVRAEVEKNGYAKERLIGAEGCGRCHADTVAQWATSAHRFSSFNNPFYVASLNVLRARDGEPNAFIQQHLESYGFKDVKTGEIKSQWCAGCHDPALLFEGKMRKAVDPGEVKAQAGLTCLACHQIKDVKGHTGNANYVWDDEFKDPYLFTEATGTIATEIHDLYLKANPEQHKADMLKPAFREGRFCGTCHKVSLEAPLNEYRYVRGQDEYDNWYDSGAPLNAARTFYQPKQSSTCQTCHMPTEPAVLGDLAAKNGVIKSHRFLAVNTALPFIRGDQDTITRIEDGLRPKVRITFAALRAGSRVALVTETPTASLTVKAEEAAEINVVVRNLGVGHTFPGGTNDSNEAWVELTVRDADGRPLLHGGSVDKTGQVEANTRIYNTVFIDKSGNRILQRNAQDIAALVYAAVVPPSASDAIRFRIPPGAIPSEAHNLKVTARLLWRKFNRGFSDFARAAEPKSFAAVGPDLPITEVGAVTAEMDVQPGENGTIFTLHAEQKVPAAERHLLTHDYGIGLLLQGDTVASRTVLEDLFARHPECDTCARTLARLHLTDRDYPAARQVLLEHETRWPGNGQAAWLWAGVLRGEGNETEAIKALARVIEVYPRDREAWRYTTEINYRSGAFQAAADAAAHMVDIDAEDATAHYYAMLAKRALGDKAGATAEEKAYRYYQRDETAQQMTSEFRRLNTAQNFAAQPIRVYDLQ